MMLYQWGLLEMHEGEENIGMSLYLMGTEKIILVEVEAMLNGYASLIPSLSHHPICCLVEEYR